MGLPLKVLNSYVHEVWDSARLLIQKLGPTQRPVAYFSKQLDSWALGMAKLPMTSKATVLLVDEVSKLTLGKLFDVLTLHQVHLKF